MKRLQKKLKTNIGFETFGKKSAKFDCVNRSFGDARISIEIVSFCVIEMQTVIEIVYKTKQWDKKQFYVFLT